jgi:hypothetical protein
MKLKSIKKKIPNPPHLQEMNIFYIFDPSNNNLMSDEIDMHGYKNHTEALVGYLGHRNFVRTTDPRGGDYAVKKKFGNRLWFNNK